jgi:hypothetical protein
MKEGDKLKEGQRPRRPRGMYDVTVELTFSVAEAQDWAGKGTPGFQLHEVSKEVTLDGFGRSNFLTSMYLLRDYVAEHLWAHGDIQLLDENSIDDGETDCIKRVEIDHDGFEWDGSDGWDTEED